MKFSKFLLLALLITLSCKNQNEMITNSDPKILIQEAKDYFQTNVLTSDSNDSSFRKEVNRRKIITKNPNWSAARVKKLTEADVIIIPLNFNEKMRGLRASDSTFFDLKNITYLVMYRDVNKKMQTEVLTVLPDEDFSRRKTATLFSGIVLIDDWQGNNLGGYLYANGTSTPVTNEIVEKQKGGRVSTLVTTCTTTDWYTCTSAGGVSLGCNYNYSETTCTTSYQLGGGGSNFPTLPGGGSSIGYGALSTDIALSPDFVAGNKPIAEYKTKCLGVQAIWNNYPNNEVNGFVTTDGKFIATDVVGLSGGQVSGLYEYQGVSYYVYSDQNPAPLLNYAGMVHAAGYYMIPVSATVHTHTPCRTDGTDGVSQNTSPPDASRAAADPLVKHWVIGCGAIAQFDSSNPNYFNKIYGNLSTTCNSIN
jgi:hypothetical protein